MTVLALVLIAALAGVHLSGTVGMNPALHALDASGYVVVKQAADVAFPRLAKPLLLGALLVTAVALVSAFTAGGPGELALLGAGLALLAVTLLAVLCGDLPLNRTMAGWDARRPPADWQSVRARWERLFAVRTTATVLATACVAAAALAR